MPDDRKRTTFVDIRPARPPDIDGIVELWTLYGEGNVDIRTQAAIEAAIYSGGLHCFLVDKKLVATGGFYPIDDRGRHTELGSSCWHPRFRGSGGAKLSVSFRAVYASFVEPGTVIHSELYPTSTKSAALLGSLGFEELREVPFAMHEHAYNANPLEPVRFFVEAPWNLSGCADIVAQALGGRYRPEKGVVYRFAPAYGFEHDDMRVMLEKLIEGDLSVIGHEVGPALDLAQWLSLRVGGAVGDYTHFLIRRTQGII